MHQSRRSAPLPLPPLPLPSPAGYFQLKSRPGLWKLRLAPGGLSGRHPWLALGWRWSRWASCADGCAPPPTAPPITANHHHLPMHHPRAGRSQELYTVASSTGASSSGQKAEAAVAGADAHQVRPWGHCECGGGRQACPTAAGDTALGVCGRSACPSILHHPVPSRPPTHPAFALAAGAGGARLVWRQAHALVPAQRPRPADGGCADRQRHGCAHWLHGCFAAG